MKTILIFLLLIMMNSCTSEKQASQLDTEIVVAIDRTDKTIRPDARQIMKLSGIDDNPWSGIKITITEITDVSTNISKIFMIEGESEIQGYSELRKAKILHLKKDLTAYLMQLDTSVSKEYSQINRSLTIICNRLTQSVASKRIVVLYSDCMENSFVNFYDPQTIRMIEHSPKTIINSLEKETPLMDLSGITIFFRYIPKDFKQDLLYHTTSNFFIKMYKTHNAMVWDNTVPLP